MRSLSEPTTVAYAGSLELPGRARLHAQPGVGYFAIGDAEGVSLTRYELVDGRFVPGASLSLQSYGVSSLGAQASSSPAPPSPSTRTKDKGSSSPGTRAP